MKKRLIIIGNSDVKRDYSDFINSCDIVIRFNNCRNYLINTGKKASIICLTNWGSPAKLFFTQKILRKLSCIDQVSQIYFVRYKRTPLENMFYYFINRELIDYGSSIICENELVEKKVIYFCRNFYKGVWKKLLKMGKTQAVMPSTGILAIERILFDEEFHDFEKYILGFCFTGWKGHPWDFEKQLVNNYLTQGLLKAI